jgi:hypothetical protein
MLFSIVLYAARAVVHHVVFLHTLDEIHLELGAFMHLHDSIISHE